MVKVRTIGAFQVEKNNPTLTFEDEIANNSFQVVDDKTYFIDCAFAGDASYRDDMVIPAGFPVRGYDLSAWVGLEMVIDMKHIPDGDYDSISEGDTLTIADDGTLAVGSASSGFYFTVTSKTTLTEQAVIAEICYASSSSSGSGSGSGGQNP